MGSSLAEIGASLSHRVAERPTPRSVGEMTVVKLNDNFCCAPVAGDIGTVLLSLQTALTAEELAQVSVNLEDSKLQLSAPPAIVLKIGQILGLSGK